MTKAWAEFLGWQYFENKKGWMPLFRLYIDPPTLQNGTTVGLNTLIRYGVEIPEYPAYKPDNKRKQATMFYCSCGLTYSNKTFMIEHIREIGKDSKNHKYSMETVTFTNLSDDGKKEVATESIERTIPETPIAPTKTATQVIVTQAEKEAKESAKKQLEEAKPKEEQILSPWAKEQYEKFNIPLPKGVK